MWPASRVAMTACWSTPPAPRIGTWRRNPDARWVFDPACVARLAETQARLLAIGGAGVKVGGDAGLLGVYAEPGGDGRYCEGLSGEDIPGFASTRFRTL